MKKMLSLVLAALLLTSFTAALSSCGSEPAQTPDTADGTQPAGTQPEETEPAETTSSVLDAMTPSDGKKLRIAFIGDSITQGTGTPAEKQATEGYPGQLQALLGDGYVVGNFGKGSSYALAADDPYNSKSDRPELTYRNTKQYQDSLAFNADIVVILLGCNDIRSLSCREACEHLQAALLSLAREYAALPTVQKVYLATHIRTTNAEPIIEFSDGEVQKIQRAAAEEGGFEVIDLFTMTREYFNVMMHYNADRVHPNKEQYGEIARAFYSFFTGMEFVPTVPALSETGVVYLDGSKASGDGSSPQSPVDTLAKAVGLLRKNGGTVVLCGPCAVSYETHLPETEAPITVTSLWEGTNYAERGAKLSLSRHLFFYGDYTLENLTVEAAASNPIISCNYHNVTFGEGIVCTLASGVTTYPLLNAGYNVGLGGVPTENVSLHGTCTFAVKSGTWAYFRGGNRRSDPALRIGTTDKDAKLKIEISGGTFVAASGSNLCAGTGMNSFEGECEILISGGVFAGNFCCVGRVGTNGTADKDPAVVTGTVRVTVTGGEFRGSIVAVQDASAAFSGRVEIRLPEALKDKLRGNFAEIDLT